LQTNQFLTLIVFMGELYSVVYNFSCLHVGQIAKSFFMYNLPGF